MDENLSENKLSEAVVGQKQLFLISVDEHIPLLIQGDLVLMYSEKEKADAAADRFNRMYSDGEIKASLIKDKKIFYARMMACGFNNFLLDGNGEVFKFSNFCTKKMKFPAKLHRKINAAQPTRTVDNDAIPFSDRLKLLNDEIVRLPEKYRNKLITAYVIGALCIVASIVLFVCAKDENSILWMLPSWSICLGLIGIGNAITVSDRVKEKRPHISKLADRSLFLYLIAIIIYIIKFVAAGLS